MAELVWHQVGDRIYQTGVDRGVLYLPDGIAVAWNGLTSVEETFSQEHKSYYLDGVKYLEHQLPGDFAASLKAFTYPDEFNQVVGVRDIGSGVFIHDQNLTSFGLSYRTLIGDDVSGIDRGYKIHLLYNLIAVPDNNAYMSLNDQSAPIEFSWSLSGVPSSVPGYRPTAHISLDSTKMDSVTLEEVETILYGSPGVNPRLLSFQEMSTFIGITITDNGDGTWTAVGPDQLITMLNATTFEIANANAVYLNTDTYNISSN
jgi:hypothetical protein